MNSAAQEGASGVAIVGTRLTKAEAGTPPESGFVWSEQLQDWIPLGQQLALERYQREQDPAHQLATYDERRTALLKFVASKLQEAEYRKGGFLIEGKLHDCYVVPGSSRKALTKLGAEKLADLLRLRRAASKVTHSVETPEYVSARVFVELVDSIGHPAGSHEAAASTAEAAFRAPGARRKYGAPGHWKQGQRGEQWIEEGPPDYRAALNDVVARASKRAFVGAVIVAAAADEIFEVAAELENGGTKDADDARVAHAASASVQHRPAPARPKAQKLGLMPMGANQGKPFTIIATDQLEARLKWCREKDPARWAELIEAISEELEQRRGLMAAASTDAEGEDLPY